SEELAACAKADGDLFVTLRDGLRVHLRRDTDAAPLARATFAIIEDFARENQIDDARRDPRVISRVAEAIIKSTYVLATSGEDQINLPFLAVGSAGPVHFERRITEGELAALVKREPTSKAMPASPPAPSRSPAIEPTPKKKGWFPF
ncbi:MAG: Hsp70 family protein, partial [Polyangiaceae bacterium]